MKDVVRHWHTQFFCRLGKKIVDYVILIVKIFLFDNIERKKEGVAMGKTKNVVLTKIAECPYATAKKETDALFLYIS